jgi:hypothetical protein
MITLEILLKDLKAESLNEIVAGCGGGRSGNNKSGHNKSGHSRSSSNKSCKNKSGNNKSGKVCVKLIPPLTIIG